jgi:hypothetical protein
MSFSTRNVEVFSSIKVAKALSMRGWRTPLGACLDCCSAGTEEHCRGAVSPTTRSTSSFNLQHSVKVPHADCTRRSRVESCCKITRRWAAGNHGGVMVSRSCCGRSGSKLKQIMSRWWRHCRRHLHPDARRSRSRQDRGAVSTQTPGSDPGTQRAELHSCYAASNCTAYDECNKAITTDGENRESALLPESVCGNPHSRFSPSV